MRIAIIAPLIGLAFASTAFADITISISEQDCAQLVRYVPSADVTYKPGIDVDGREVAPADLGGSQTIPVPDRFQFPITIDLGDRLGIPSGGDADYIARMPVGVVSVAADGRVTFNGVELTDAETAELAARCQQQGAAR